MSKYTLVARSDNTGFNVEIEGRDGVRQSILNFETDALAQAWIRQDERLNFPANPFALSRHTSS